MDINVGAYGSGAAGSSRQESSSRTHRHGSDASSRMEGSRSNLGRTHSGSSNSMVSEASYASKSSRKKTQKSNSGASESSERGVQRNDTKKKMQKLAGGERKGSLVDKWSKMMDEYEDSYVPAKEEKKQKRSASSKSKRKVNKLSNVDAKYDNVKQVFGRSMPLAHQTAPPGAKARDIESESDRSEVSQQSSRKSSKSQSRKKTSEVSSSEKHSTSVTSSSLYPGWTPGSRMIQGKWLTNRSTEAADDADMRQAHLASSHSHSHRQVIKETTERTPHVYHKEKYQKHHTRGKKNIDETAAEIVDDVVNKALKFLYGTKTTRITDLGAQKNTNEQRAYDENISNSYSETNIDDVTEIQRNLRKENVHESYRPGKERHYKVKPVQGSARMRKYDHGYDGYGESEESSIQSPSSPTGNHRQEGYYSTSDSYNYSLPSQKSNNLGIGRMDSMQSGAYSSDSEYSTTLEIRQDNNDAQIRRHNASNTKMNRKPRPPTLTKGTVTKFKHELEHEEMVQSPPIAIQAAPVPITRNVHIAPSAVVAGYMPQERQMTSPPGMSQPYILNRSYDAMSSTVDGSFPLGNMQHNSNLLLQQVPPQRVDLLVDTSQLLELQQVDMSQQQNQISSYDLPTIQEVDENQYAAFSNEPIIMAGLDKDGFTTRNAEQHIINNQGGKVYGTQPAVNMSTKQQLNFFLFNQVKKESETPIITEEPAVVFDAAESNADREVEYRQMEIFNKGTQTLPNPEPTPPPRRKKIITETTQQRLKSPPNPVPKLEQREIHHYITTERQIETLPTEKDVMNMSCQTDSPPRTPIPVQEEVTEAIFTQAFMPPIAVAKTRTPPPTPPPPTPPRLPTPVIDEPLDSDEEIIETIVIEEREKRIVMSIAEEIEFTSNRTQGGTTINTTNESGEIKPFWIPEKWEAVVDRRKQKIIRVKDTENDEGDSKQGIGPIAHTVGDSQPLQLPPPKYTTETSTSKSSSSMLEKDLEKQLHPPSLSELYTGNQLPDRSFTESYTRTNNQVPDQPKSREIPITKRSNSYEYKIPIATDFPLQTSRSPSPPYSPYKKVWDTDRKVSSPTVQPSQPMEYGDNSSDTSSLRRYKTQQNYNVNSKKPPAPPPPPLQTTTKQININKTALLTHNPPPVPVFPPSSIRATINRTSMALPTESSFTYQPNDDDKLPESLDHFDKMVATLERELPLPTALNQHHTTNNNAAQNRPPGDYIQSYKDTNYPSTTARTFTNIAANTKPVHLGKFNQSYLKAEDTNVQTTRQDENIRKEDTIPSHLKAVSNSRGTGKTIYSSKSRPVQRTNSKLEPENFSFGTNASGHGKESLGESNEMLFDPAQEYLTPLELRNQTAFSPRIQTTDMFKNSVVHNIQSKPQIETKIMKDEDGNLVKITEMKHSLSKMVESPASDSLRGSVASEYTILPSENRDLARHSFVSMKLMESEPLMESYTETGSPTVTSSVAEVTEETQVKMVPIEFDVMQKSLKVNDDDGTDGENQSFLYNMNTNELNHIDGNEELRRKYLAGETMRTSL